jgi:uncharacterized cofD-like protein
MLSGVDRRRPAAGSGPRVIAIGGGHGLSASLRALRRVTADLTAVVGVSDDGGSSGRLRREFEVPPPGDLRMALAALCGDDSWGRTWSRVVQHRFGGDGELAGHAVGNLLITALWEETGNVVEGLEWVAALLGAHGRVLPVATRGLDIVAEVGGLSEDGTTTTVHGQVAIASSGGSVTALRLEPPDVPACPEALAAIAGADVVVLGPGSWFTSVLAPLQVPGVAAALADTTASIVVVLNLVPQDGETTGFTPAEHLRVLAEHAPWLRVDAVLADDGQLEHTARLRAGCAAVGAALVLAPLAASDGSPRHDVDLLAAALGRVVEGDLSGR